MKTIRLGIGRPHRVAGRKVGTVSRTIQRLAVGLETAVYGWVALVAGKGGAEVNHHDSLASALTLPTAEPAGPPAAWSQAS